MKKEAVIKNHILISLIACAGISVLLIYSMTMMHFTTYTPTAYTTANTFYVNHEDEISYALTNGIIYLLEFIMLFLGIFTLVYYFAKKSDSNIKILSLLNMSILILPIFINSYNAGDVYSTAISNIWKAFALSSITFLYALYLKWSMPKKKR